MCRSEAVPGKNYFSRLICMNSARDMGAYICCSIPNGFNLQPSGEAENVSPEE